MVRSLPFIVDLVLTVVAIVDIALIDNSRVRGLPKWAWVLISIFLFVVGPLLWFFVGLPLLIILAWRWLRRAPQIPHFINDGGQS